MPEVQSTRILHAGHFCCGEIVGKPRFCSDHRETFSKPCSHSSTISLSPSSSVQGNRKIGLGESRLVTEPSWKKRLKKFPRSEKASFHPVPAALSMAWRPCCCLGFCPHEITSTTPRRWANQDVRTITQLVSNSTQLIS